ncbi:glycosyltransferase family 39 protein [Paludisphaera rhizosphaerae]|uniref:glycosyltransferase family 39 protein n=1 Tax=Paludisphaera rhizosphaerae TaxID=2711216 RepID=UPI0013EC8F7D|nr:glycosyltransferase family 39 protein [Paludisphaera rhizosphaerae]
MSGRQPLALTTAAAVVGLALVWQAAAASSATYDETTYLNAAARWWRQGDRVGVTRMGSPNLFWKLQLAPTFAALDLMGRGALIDDQPARQPDLLPIARIGSSWIWLLGLALTAWWARLLSGPWAMALAAWLYALSPNLLAHGGLVTMETPVTVAATAVFMSFWAFLWTGRRRWFWASAALCGLAFACKFTAIVLPPILGAVWLFYEPLSMRRLARMGLAMAGYLIVMLAADAALNGFAILPLSPTSGDHPSASGFGPLGGIVARLYETPIPQDWVGFAGQLRHQASGGPGYLLGERRMGGWRYYYLVALAVKVPPLFWLMAAWRGSMSGWRRSLTQAPDRMLLQSALLFFAIASAGSSRNYGVRYLLPVAPLAVMWLSGLVRGEERGRPSRLIGRAVIVVGLLGQAAAVISVQPNPLTYFNVFAGGRAGGRRVLADSNLDWGQGLRALARLQRGRPEFRDLTIYTFGTVDPSVYGVVGTAHVIDADEGHTPPPPPLESVATPYVAVSASLQYGPWGPAGLFRPLDGLVPIAMTDDGTIAVYRVQ